MKTCTCCGETRDLAEFYPKKGSKGGRRAMCKTCHLASQWEDHLRRKYGLTLQQHAEMRVMQEGRCAICRAAFDKTPHVDHDHTTGAVRALLCTNCNRGIGHLQDSPEILCAAADYIRHHRAKQESAQWVQ